jgi:hypothetical protein
MTTNRRLLYRIRSMFRLFPLEKGRKKKKGFKGDSAYTESLGKSSIQLLSGDSLCLFQRNKDKNDISAKITRNSFGFQHRRARLTHCEVWRACGLGSVMPSIYFIKYFVSLLSPVFSNRIISTPFLISRLAVALEISLKTFI